MLDQKHRTTINYFAMPPSTFGAICKGLGEAKLNHEPARVVMEKPLGTDLASSRVINDQVAEYFNESGLPYRPLSRQRDGAEPVGAAFRQLAVRIQLG